MNPEILLKIDIQPTMHLKLEISNKKNLSLASLEQKMRSGGCHFNILIWHSHEEKPYPSPTLFSVRLRYPNDDIGNFYLALPLPPKKCISQITHQVATLGALLLIFRCIFCGI
uniref:Uncharacterized protein n=1 Tax=Rhizophora mucronata TaxID=61149 RepID=A0A2P2KVD4_RHIMU